MESAKKPSIVLGLNNCVDYELVWNAAVLEELAAAYSITAAQLGQPQEILSERDLMVSILAFMRDGTGGERAVASVAMLEGFAARFSYTVTLGGTSVRAALAMRGLGRKSALHLGTLNDHVRRLLPQGCPYICGASRDSLYPHVIIQFQKGSRVRVGDIDIVAPRSNRLIYLDDPAVVALNLSPLLGDLLDGAGAFLISGFNSMQDPALLEQRLSQLLGHMRRLPKTAVSFYEDSGCKRPQVNQRVRQVLVPVLDVVSLNEDEMQSYLGRPVPLLDAPEVLRAAAQMQQMFAVPCVVVHTRHWALAYGPGAARYQKALMGGIAMATTRFRFGDGITTQRYKNTLALGPQPEGEALAHALNEQAGGMACCLPSLDADDTRATTIGLGDAFVGGFLNALLPQDPQD